jgi:predicted transposase YdaD
MGTDFNMTTNQQDEFDSPWKDMLEAYFQDFMRFFFPQIHDDIEWSRGYDFLDQELQQVVRDAELGKRIADKLVKVWKLDGEETWVLIHLEIQNQEEGQFSERMFVYFYRLRDRYNRPIASLAILGDERKTWRPQSFQSGLWGCEVTFRFPMIKLMDYEQRWDELEASQNPFAIAVMTHLKTKETRRDAEARKEWKFKLTRRLYEQGYERQDILNLFRFIDWMLELPEGLKQAFQAELEQYEQERQMPYVTSIERMGIEKGIEKGREEERQAIALNLLRQGISVEAIAQATGLTIAQLQQLQSQVEEN